MSVNLDKPVYKMLLAYKQAAQMAEKRGVEGDVTFLSDDLWLQDTVVQERVVKLNGAWNIFLVFVHVNNPFLFIKRFIKTQYSQEKAVQDGFYMRRLAAKDQRGTLHLNTKKFQLSSN